VQITGHVNLFTPPATFTNLAGVTITLTGCGSGSTTTDASGNYSLAGTFTGNCVVTPSGLGKIYDPVSQTIANIINNTTNINFIAYNSINDVPRPLTFVNTYVTPGNAASMPVMFNSQGNEASIAFSFSYDINPLASPPVPVCGTDMTTCTITLDNS